MTSHSIAAQLAALGHPARLKIMSHLACDNGRCCGDVVSCVDLAQSTVSQHLKILVDAGLVHYVRKGKQSQYTIDAKAVDALKQEFTAFAGACCEDKSECCG